MNGFAPIFDISEWKDGSSHDLQWQLNQVRNASALLHYNEASEKYSAWGTQEEEEDSSGPLLHESDTDVTDDEENMFRGESSSSSDDEEEIIFKPRRGSGDLPQLRILEEPHSSVVPSSRSQVRAQEEKHVAAEHSRKFLPKNMPVVVLDAPNICMRHGNHRLFSTHGLVSAVTFWKLRGFKVVAFIPDFYLEYDTIAGKKRTKALGFSNVRASQLPDSVQKLNELKSDKILFSTPSGDYDDSYCIKYAQNHGGIIVSNDRFRDAVKNAPRKNRAEFSKWLRSHVVSFTFVNDEFLPNPDFMFPTG
eukprot:TRINITY_DN2796_c0_g1_i1.p1 TRINITY_DN2796_c0_g1~~TRINITY_DN2796_c0_g1_i1.p1  ORF type:complete len:306 (-),score=76.38 TRINITY_DN2796_c0_g1_i1:369-1286(-)